MRIYKMTATFGKLEHATLELKPGLNVITAPNEWGKSTWCAFLVAMLYGLDTRAKNTKTTLADKERYAPWSGSPMSGRIDLNWKGRDITIERATRRRIPLGEFQAYETATGVPVPELTASNCGAVLLGVEQTVFRRAGFIRHADLPVTQDEALRRRLNALVTTGDDSGAADRLADQLKELKNKCRYNRTGLLPQAEAERDALEDTIREMDQLDLQIQKHTEQLEETRLRLIQLDNHQQTLAYNKMLSDIARVEQAGAVMEQLRKTSDDLEGICKDLPSQEDAERRIRELRAFREQWNSIQTEVRMIPEEPVPPRLEQPYFGMDPREAREMYRKDALRFEAASGSKAPVLLIVVGIFGVLATAMLVFLRAYLFAGISGAAALVALVWGILERRSMRKQTRDLLEKYGHGNWKRWADPLDIYERELTAYEIARQEYRNITADVQTRLAALENRRDALCGTQEPEKLLDRWQEIQETWIAYGNAHREALRAADHYEALRSMVRPVEKPAMPDTLSQTEEETARQLTQYAVEQQRLQNRLGQYQGRMESLGSREINEKQLQKVRNRISRLEDTYSALVIAQEALAAARGELQRRFAPRITRRAQQMLARMTDGRYQSVTMQDDFSLQTSADREDILRDALWRSDGTLDQLYLALRLAVAEELTPNAPLVLDDALVRFDDQRMSAAVKILRDLAENRQVILFTCQGRENDV